MSISVNLQEIRNRIRQSASGVNRDPNEIRIIAVTKYVDVNQINEAIKAGITEIGENRVQDGVAKFPYLSGKVIKHMIGTLQTNKVKQAVEHFDLIHSVDRAGLVEELTRQAAKMQKKVEVLVQLNLTAEETKHGISVDELPGLINQIRFSSYLIPAGLMTIGPLTDDSELVRPVFRRMREVFMEAARNLELGPNWRYLSMGMSQDYQVAVEEGANLLRIGTAIFKSE
ncbi:MAG: YggS family pyridoxal phosphate-dependent enzyme [Firmicutes bacterium]|nr:YggS family pyridoxal phosphate-dependent enzyme [Bacillota bacterium]